MVINAVDNSKATVLISKIGIGDISPKDVLCENDDDTIFIIDLKAIDREAKNYKEKVLQNTVKKAEKES